MDLSRLNSIICTILAYKRQGAESATIISKVSTKYDIQPKAVELMLTAINEVAI